MTVDTTVRPGSGHRRLLILGLTGLAIAAMFAFAYKASSKMPDFEVYWRAAHRAAAGEALYQAGDGHWLFKYLPAFAVVTIPITLVPLPVAKAIWFLTIVAALVVLLRMTLALLPELHKPRWVLYTLTVIVMGKFYAHELVLGQSNLLLVAVVTAAMLELKRGRELRAGALFALAVVFKPYAVIFLPWLLARRRASIVSATIGMAAVLVLPVVRYGFTRTVQLHMDWWDTVTRSIEPNLLSPDNVSWLAMYSRWFHPGPIADMLAAGTTLAALGVVAYVFWLRRSLTFPELLEGSLLLVLIPLLSPQGWDYTLLMATPAVMCLVNYEDQLPASIRAPMIAALAIVGFSIYDLMGRAAYRTFMLQSGITLCFFIITGALVAMRRQQLA